jgi:hypothetical protein
MLHRLIAAFLVLSMSVVVSIDPAPVEAEIRRSQYDTGASKNHRWSPHSVRPYVRRLGWLTVS